MASNQAITPGAGQGSRQAAAGQAAVERPGPDTETRPRTRHSPETWPRRGAAPARGPQYRGTDGSTCKLQALMPPARFWVAAKPRWRMHSTARAERAPLWQWMTERASG